MVVPIVIRCHGERALGPANLECPHQLSGTSEPTPYPTAKPHQHPLWALADKGALQGPEYQPFCCVVAVVFFHRELDLFLRAVFTLGANSYPLTQASLNLAVLGVTRPRRQWGHW